MKIFNIMAISIACLITISLHTTSAQAPLDESDDVFGPPRQVNHALSIDENVIKHALSDDGNWLVYEVEKFGSPRTSALYSVPTTGGSPVKISRTTQASSRIRLWSISPTGGHVVYIQVDPTNDFTQKILSVPIGGGESTLLNNQADNFVVISNFAISPNGETVVYLSDELVRSRFEIFQTSINGGIPKRVNQSIISGGDVASNFKIDDSNAYVVYIADQNVDNKREIFSASLSTGDVVRLNLDLPNAADVVRDPNQNEFIIDSNAGRVIYQVDDRSGEDIQHALFSSSLSDGNTIEVSPFATSDLTFALHPPTSRLVFSRDGVIKSTLSNRVEQLTLGTLSDKVTTSIKFSKNGQAVIFDSRSSGPNRLFYSLAALSNTISMVEAPIDEFINVRQFDFLPNNSSIIFTPDSDNFSNDALLYSVDINSDGSLKPAKVLFNGPVTLNMFGDFLISPDSRRIVFDYNENSFHGLSRIQELISVNISQATSSKIRMSANEGRRFGPLNFTPDGQALVFAARAALQSQRLLYISRINISRNKEPESEICVPIKTRDAHISLVCF